MDFRHLEKYQPQLRAILRIVVALLFMEHGLAKLIHFPVPQPGVPTPLPPLLVAAAVVVWERFPGSRDVWVCLFALTWVAMAVTTPLTKSQIAAGWPVAVQFAVPGLGLVGWLVAKELARSAEAQARQPDAHASEPVQPDLPPKVDTPRT